MTTWRPLKLSLLMVWTIAIILRVSIKTVETHRASAMHKVGAKSSADLTLYAVRNDLVEV